MWYAALEKRNGKKLQQKFINATIAICGLGGLGSNIAIALARSGIGKLILIDFDKVDLTNIHRQMYKLSQIDMYKTFATLENIKEISPFIDVETINEKISDNNISSLFQTSDIIIEAFDDPTSKATLVNKVLEIFPHKYIISASGMAGIGSPNLIKTRKITDKFYLSGDGVSEVDYATPLFTPRVMLCAAHQAQVALRILAEKYDI